MRYYDSKVTVIDGKNRINSQSRTEAEQARVIAKSLGFFTAARYLALRNWSIDAAVWLLLGKGVYEVENAI